MIYGVFICAINIDILIVENFHIVWEHISPSSVFFLIYFVGSFPLQNIKKLKLTICGMMICYVSKLDSISHIETVTCREQ